MNANQHIGRLVAAGLLPMPKIGTQVVDRFGAKLLIVSVDPSNDTAVVSDETGKKQNMSFWYLLKVCKSC